MYGKRTIRLKVCARVFVTSVIAHSEGVRAFSTYTTQQSLSERISGKDLTALWEWVYLTPCTY